MEKENKSEIIRKIENEEWARTIWNNLLERITPYADRHQTDAEWLVSRLAMYWEDGQRYTQCYLKRQNWDYGTGNAPVPTVRMPGMRIWNDYSNVPLKDRTPYNTTGDMWGVSRQNPEAPPVLVPYKQSGHMIRGNNNEILQIAAQSAFIYFINNEEKYAKMAADIYYTWLLGTYYMNPILDPDKSTGGPGGYEPGGICGYYDYEQIHDDLAMRAAPIYDFLHDYLDQNPHPHLKEIKKNITELSGIVFKRFIDIGMVRGGKSGNWNVNGWNMMMLPMLVLENNAYYEDGKGRDYYLKYYTDLSTQYHDALPDILKVYDSVTGLWPESPGYALGTINMLIDLALPVYIARVNTIENNPVMQKAAFAVFPWLDARGNIVVFGDSRGGRANYKTFERLLTYYTWNNDLENATVVANALQQGMESGQYNRKRGGWEDLILNVSTVPQNKSTPQTDRMAYSPFHRHLIMKNGNDPETALMAVLYGGKKGHHLTPNGLAMQLYGMGWALGPDASGYESYWSKDMAYHQSATGCNTIIPGYTEGPITIHAMEPFVPDDSFVNPNEISPACSFIDVSAGEKRRMMAIIRTSSSTGYYVDIFRSNLDNNDYIYHNIGNRLDLFNTEEKPLSPVSGNKLGNQYGAGYDFFSNQKSIDYNETFQARWQINARPAITMNMWMAGQPNRTLYTVDAPYTNFNKNLSPAGISMAPQTTPSLIVRQEGLNAWQHPFIALFEPYQSGSQSVKTVVAAQEKENFTFLNVQSNSLNAELHNNREFICYAIDNQTYKPLSDIAFRGIFGVISENADELNYLYLGRGELLERGDYRIEAQYPVSASVFNKNGEWFYSSDGEITVKIEKKVYTLPAGYNKKCEQLVIYPAPEGAALNDDFTVKVRQAGQEWKVSPVYLVNIDEVRDTKHNVEDASMAYFDFSGEVEVSVRYNRGTIQTARVRPLSYQIVPQITGNTLTFKIDKPRNLSVEVNGDIFHNLHLFANPIEEFKPDPNDENVIYFGPGIHTPEGGRIRVPSGKTLYLSGGAVLMGQILVNNARDVKILGRGMVDRSVKEGIRIANSKNVYVEGLICTQVPTGGSDSVTIRNVKSISYYGWGDGMNVFASNNVLFDGVFCRNSDDCTTVYATRKGFVGGCKNITMQNSTLWADVAHPIFIGIHGNTPNPEIIEDLNYINIDILDHKEKQIDYQGCLGINAGDNNLIRKVRFENIRIEDFRQGQLVNLRIFFNDKYCTAPGRGIEDILFKDISYNGDNAEISIIAGYNEERKVKNIRFENLRINGQVISDDMPGKPAWYKTSDMARFWIGEFVENVSFTK